MIFESKIIRRIVGVIAGAVAVTLAFVLPPMPVLFVALGYLYGAVFILPELYGV